MWPGYWICKAFPSQGGRPSIFSFIGLLINLQHSPGHRMPFLCPSLKYWCVSDFDPVLFSSHLSLLKSFSLVTLLSIPKRASFMSTWTLIYRGPCTQKDLMLGVLMLCGCRFKILNNIIFEFLFYMWSSTRQWSVLGSHTVLPPTASLPPWDSFSALPTLLFALPKTRTTRTQKT